MVDPLSIKVSCLSLIKSPSRHHKGITKLVKDFRNAKVELLDVASELGSLERIVQLIRHDCETYEGNGDNAFPAAVQGHLRNILTTAMKRSTI